MLKFHICCMCIMCLLYFLLYYFAINVLYISCNKIYDVILIIPVKTLCPCLKFTFTARIKFAIQLLLAFRASLKNKVMGEQNNL